MEYTFKSKDGHCPESIAFGRRYYIQDRYIGAGRYEYALMSRPDMVVHSIRFKSRKDCVSYLVGTTVGDDITANLLMGQLIDYQCGNLMMLNTGDQKYVWDEENKTLRTYTEPVQETGYCDTYSECLGMAKKILSRLQERENGDNWSLN